MTYLVRLPWPPSGLWPNRRRGHWAKHASAAKAARIEAGWLARENAVPPGEWSEGRVPVRVTFYPPRRNKWDVDNAIAACKPYFDAVASRAGLDDSRWDLEPVVGPVVKGGAVVVEIAP